MKKILGALLMTTMMLSTAQAYGTPASESCADRFGHHAGSPPYGVGTFKKLQQEDRGINESLNKSEIWFADSLYRPGSQKPVVFKPGMDMPLADLNQKIAEQEYKQQLQLRKQESLVPTFQQKLGVVKTIMANQVKFICNVICSAYKVFFG